MLYIVNEKNQKMYKYFNSEEDLIFSEIFSYTERMALYKSLETNEFIQTPKSLKGLKLVKEDKSPAKPQYSDVSEVIT